MSEHGKERRRVWRKFHLAIDAKTHAIVATEVSLEAVGDNEVLPTLFNRLWYKVKKVGSFAPRRQRECHALLKRKGAKAIIPPRKNAALWEGRHPRNETVKAGKLKKWKLVSGYLQHSKAETALARVKAMNKMTGPSMPVRQQVNGKE